MAAGGGGLGGAFQQAGPWSGALGGGVTPPAAGGAGWMVQRSANSATAVTGRTVNR